jgi:hypothetical protein
MLKHILKSQFLRQIMGALGGTLIALITYGAYHLASDAMHAMLDEPSQEQAADPAQMQRDQKVVEIGANARAWLTDHADNSIEQ